jgi:hypothetical protein
MKKILMMFTLVCGFAFSGKAQNLTQANFTGVMVPKVMASGTSSRLHIVYRATLTNLDPSTTYRYFNQLAIRTDFGTTNLGASNPLFMNAGTAWVYTFSPSLTTAGQYGEFTTDANGNYTGWFSNVNTGNSRFTAGNYVFPSIVIGNSTGTALERRVMNDSIQVLAFNTTSGANDGTGIWGNSEATDKNIVVLYDNTAGTGRPVAMTFAEMKGLPKTPSTVAYYFLNVDSVSGAWGTIIPNSNANGIRRIEQLAFSNAASVGFNISSNGTWPTTSANTANPTGGGTPLVISKTDAPLVPKFPTLTVTTTGFNSSFGPVVPNTPSSSSSFTVSGTDLTGDITISVAAPFEIRTGSNSFGQNVTLTQTGGSVSNQTIDVRFNPNAAGTFTDSISIVTSGATTVKIGVSGQAVSAPSLGANIASFNSNLGAAGIGVNSAIGTFEVNGVNLTGDITVSVNLPFEVRTVGGIFSQSATVSPSSGTVSNTSIEIRFNSMSIGQFSDSIEIASPGAQTIKVFVQGETKAANIKFANTTKLSGTEGKTATLIVKVVAENQGMGTTSVSFGSATNRTAIAPDHFTFGGNNNLNFNAGMDTMDLEITLVDDNNSGPRIRRGKLYIQTANNGATFSNDSIDIDIFENDYKHVKIAEIKQNNANFEPLGFDSLYAVSGVVYGYNTRNAGSGYSFTTIDNTGGIGNFAPSSASTFGYVITEGDSITMKGRLTHFNGLSQLDFLDTIIFHKSNATLKSPVVVNTLSEATESDLVRVNKVKIITPEPTWQAGTSGRNYRVYNTVTFDTFDIRILPVCPLVGQAIPTDEFSVIGIGGQFANRVPRNFGYQIFPRFLTDIILPDALGDFNLLTPANNTVLDLQGDPNQVVNITWEASVPATGVAAPTYEWMIDPAGNFGAPLLKLPAGANTNLSLTYKQIADALPTLTVGSSVDAKWTVLATSGAESKFAVAEFNIKINRGALTSVKETTQNIARIYPNPAADVIHIDLKEKAERIVLTDVSGRIVYTLGVSADTISINTQNLNNGVYFVKIYTAEKQSIEKIVINK